MRSLNLLFATLVLLTGCRKASDVALNGRLEGYLSDLSPRVSGRIVEIPVREGQRVKAGDLLVRLAAEELDAAVARDVAGLQAAQARRLEADHGSRPETLAQLEARVRDAEAALKVAADQHRRLERLAAERIVSQADLDRGLAERDRAAANLQLQQKVLAEGRAGLRIEQRQGVSAEQSRAEASLTQSRALARFTEIRAPFDGVVIHRLREAGSVVGPGQSILTLAAEDRLWVRVYIPQPLQSRLKLGMGVQVHTGDKRVMEATLDEVSSEAEFTPKMVETAEERVNLVYPAKVHIPRGFDQGLLPGTAVTVHLKPRS